MLMVRFSASRGMVGRQKKYDWWNDKVSQMWGGTGQAVEVLPKVRSRDGPVERRMDDTREQATKVAEVC